MKFIEANIFGFGKLKDFKIDFSPKLTVIFGNNEVGKSTLQMFLCAMLYGLVNPDNKTRLKLPEFDKYEPWDKVKFGGVLKYILDSGNKIEVYRTFEPHKVEIRDGDYGKDITTSFPITKNKEPFFAQEHLGLSFREFAGTCFIRQLKINELDEKDQSLISARLISLAETGDEELSVNKAIEKLNELIRLKIGVEDSRSQRPLRLAIDEKESIEKKLKIAYENHNVILKLISQVQKSKQSLQIVLNESEIIKHILLNEEIKNLEQKIQAISEYKNSLNQIETDIRYMPNYDGFPKHEWKEVIELNSRNLQVKTDMEKLSEEKEYFNNKYEISDNKIKQYTNFEELTSEIIEKLTNMESERNILQYNIIKEQNSFSVFRQKLNNILKIILQYKNVTSELKENIFEQIQEKELLEVNLKLQEKEIEKLNSNLRSKNFYFENNIQKSKNLKIFGIILCLTVIGIIIGIPILLKVKKIKKETDIINSEIIEINKQIEFLDKNFEIDSDNYQALHKKQLALQNELKVTNSNELKAKYNEFLKLENSRLQVEEKIKENENKILSYSNEINNINHEAKIILDKFNLNDFKTCKEKYDDYKELNKQKNKLKEELSLNIKRINEKEEEFRLIQEKLIHIYKIANVASYEEFQKHFNDAQKYFELKNKKNEICEKISLQTQGKPKEALEKEFTEIKEKLIFYEGKPINDQKFNNIPFNELKVEDEKQTNKIHNLKEEIIQLETMLKYMNENLDSVSELEAEAELYDEKIKYFKIEKQAIDITKINLEEIKDIFHRFKFMPQLKKIIIPWLIKLTDNKYEEILVDENLKVYVRVPEIDKLVDITKLSVGAQEQIYFIFKIAIAKILTKGKENVPIVLDDIFVNFDYVRRNKIWNLLLEMSDENQIILLTCHDHFYNEWKEHLNYENLRYEEEIKNEFKIIKF